MRTLKLLFILIIVTLSLPKGVSAQYVQPMRYPHYSITQQANIGVGTVRTTAASAYLEVGPTSSANKGFLPPRLSTAERDAIASPANGLMIYNKTTNDFQGWNGSAWVNFYIDTAASFISDFYRVGDSVKYVKGGIHTFAFKDSTGGGIPTLQQVFSAEGNEAVITSSVDISPSTTGISFLMGNNGVWHDIIMQSSNQFNLSSNAISLSAGNNNLLSVGPDSIKISPYLGRLVIDTLNYTLSTTGKKVLIRDTATGLVQNIDPSLLGASSYTFTNGLTESGGTVKLGGTLTENTTIETGSNSFLIDNGSQYLLQISAIATRLNAPTASSGIEITDAVTQISGDDSVVITQAAGDIRLKNLTSAVGTKALRYNPTTGLVSYADTTSGGSTSPAGSDTYVQFNDGGSFGGDAGLNYNKTDNELKINTATDNGAYKLQGEGGMYWKLDGTNAFKIVNSSGSDRVTVNASSGNLDTYTFSSQNFSTSTGGNSTFSGSFMRQQSGAYFQGWQQAFSMIRTYPGTGSSPQSTVIFDNTTETSPASDYQIATFKLSGTSVAFVDKDGKYNAQSTVTAGGTTGNQTINKPTGTVNIAAAGSTVTVTNSTCTANSIVYAVLRTNDATATGIKSVVPSAGSFVITLNAAATAEVSVGFIVFN